MRRVESPRVSRVLAVVNGTILATLTILLCVATITLSISAFQKLRYNDKMLGLSRLVFKPRPLIEQARIQIHSWGKTLLPKYVKVGFLPKNCFQIQAGN